MKYFPSANFTVKGYSTEELNQKANRPLLGGLCSHKFISEYPNFILSNVDDYLQQKSAEVQLDEL